MPPNAACVVSLIDRLIHNCEIIALDGTSYRLKEADERASKRTQTAAGYQEIMSTHRRQHLPLPAHWTPAEVLAVFELLDLLRDQLWHYYRDAIQYALREQLSNDRDPRQYDLPLDINPL